LHSFGKPSLQCWSRASFEPVDHDLDLMFDLPLESQVVGQIDDLAVDAGPHEARSRELRKQVFIFPFLAAYDGSQNKKGRPGRQFVQYGSDDLLTGLRRHGPAAVGTVPEPDASVEHTEVIVDFGDRADRRAGISSASFLLDRNRRTEPVDSVHL